ncbi:MAG: hypothetical protein ACRD9R_03250, partial [Pyrinomonadaceae bacterium]
MKRDLKRKGKWLLLILTCAVWLTAHGQESTAARQNGESVARRSESRGPVRSVTIPVRVGESREQLRREEFQQLSLTVLEDGEPQEILSARGADRAPLALAILVQDDLVSGVGNEIAGLAKFVRGLPQGSRVFVGFMRAGSIQVRQRFTNDLERAAKSFRIPVGSPTAAPFNPFEQTYAALKRFESLPAGTRRAALVISDGLDVSRGVESSSPTQSIDLQRAINEAHRRGVAVYTIYYPTGITESNRGLVGNAQSSLLRLADETGGKPYFTGSGAPVSFDPYLSDLTDALNRQFALTYLSTHAKKGFHRIEVQAAAADVT